MRIRTCSNPACRREIGQAFGFVHSADLLEMQQGVRAGEDVRELCGRCELSFSLIEDEAAKQAYLVSIGWADGTKAE